jgi:uncharacterized membrane protein
MKLIERDILKMFGVVTVVNVAMLFIRNFIEDDTHYNFLLWNLFLGFVPFAVAYILLLFEAKMKFFLFLVLNGVWLLFYPNAPYMMTDLIHVQSQSSTVIYDTLIIYSIATLSLFFGFYSLRWIFELWEKRFSKRTAMWVLIGSIVLSGLGNYLGRILRLNSWDLFTHPGRVFFDIWHHLWPISSNHVTYYILALFTIIQLMFFWLIHSFRKA